MRVSLLSALLLAAPIVAAGDLLQTSVVGCNFDAISSNPGFDGKFYQFSDMATSLVSDPNFYAQGYQSGSVIGVASDISEINFSIPGGVQNINGVSVNSSNFAIEYTGYFKGMYLFQDFSFKLNFY
ncbi:hypothetical protein PMKS-003613 [Pichia membranifaciens]|uniref:Hyphally-regulated cell wall protein N-terminal domain-containing protein n=1 Tax=Pichia membranifaciens TaxID=4926 RepID=A0A1Q2YKN1_9ASCO|nr:hypothetical protein PMKS-003613 [Pichia membranifaciens]